jgi:outer membrane protein TolC
MTLPFSMSRVWRIWLRPTLLAGWLVSAGAFARPAKAEDLGIDTFVGEVLERNPGLRARRLTRDAAALDASAAGLFPDPEASVMLDQVPERHEGEMPMVRYQLSQMIPWPGKLGLMEGAAARRTDAAEANARARRLDLTRDAKSAYWMLLMNKGSRDVASAGRGLLETVTRAALARYGAGSGTHHDVARAQVELSTLDVEVLDLEGERLAMLAMLNALRDRPSDSPLPEPSAPAFAPLGASLSIAQLERRAFEQRPELETMRAMRREEEAMAALARRERYPDLMTSIWYNQMLGEPDTAGVMVGVTLPIFDVRRQTRRAEAADHRASSADGDRQAMQAMIRFEISDAVRRIVTAERTLDLLGTVASPRANQSFAASLAAYSTGTTDVTAVLQAWRALQTLERARVEASVNWLSALADLERAVGGPWNERVSP